jgi:hypothetical protein
MTISAKANTPRDLPMALQREHMQKAREVGSDIRVALALRYSQEACWIWSDLDADTEMDAIIASALSEAYRSGVEAERARCERIAMMHAAQRNEDDEWDAGYRAAGDDIATVIRKA